MYNNKIAVNNISYIKFLNKTTLDRYITINRNINPENCYIILINKFKAVL